MLSTLCFLYSKLHKDEAVIIRLPDDYTLCVTREDKVEKRGGAFVIYRKNGRITTVNPAYVVTARITATEDWYL